VRRLVPSAEFPTATQALQSLAEDASSISAAVAFVTDSGVDELARVVAGREQIEVVRQAGFDGHLEAGFCPGGEEGSTSYARPEEVQR